MKASYSSVIHSPTMRLSRYPASGPDVSAIVLKKPRTIPRLARPENTKSPYCVSIPEMNGQLTRNEERTRTPSRLHCFLVDGIQQWPARHWWSAKGCDDGSNFIRRQRVQPVFRNLLIRCRSRRRFTATATAEEMNCRIDRSFGFVFKH